MRYISKTCRFIDLVKVDEKFVAVSFEFVVRNGTQKWVNERDWGDIEETLGSYIEQKKYLMAGHMESIDVIGDIQLEVANIRCPSYVHKMFNQETSQATLHSIQMSVVVKFGGIQKKYLEATTVSKEEHEADETNGKVNVSTETSNDQGSNVPEIKSDEETYVPQSTTPRLTRATYTPSKKIKTSGFEEYVPSGIPTDTVNQYKATKRKRGEKITPDAPDRVLEDSSALTEPHRESVLNSKASKSKKKMETQMPDSTATKKLSTKPKSSPKKKTNELFGPEDSDTDTEVEKNATKAGASKGNNQMELTENRDPLYNLRTPSPPRKRKKEKKPMEENPVKPEESTQDRNKVSAITGPTGPTMSPRKNCHHIPINDLLESFELVNVKMEKIIERFDLNEKMQIPYTNDFSQDVLNSEQWSAVEDFILNNYLHNEHRPYTLRCRMEDLLTKYVLPEWILILFMQEYEMNRKEAVDYLNDKKIEENYFKMKNTKVRR